MHVMHAEVGWIEVICGPMFSGKSEELIRRLRRAQIARQSLEVFKPAIDDRYHESNIVSHSRATIEAHPVSSADEVARLVRSDTRVVGIDEAQFFDEGIVDVAERLAGRGVRVVLAGLDQDYTGRPFEPMPRLMAIAEYVTKMLAICTRCGAPAGRSQRLSAARDPEHPHRSDQNDRVLVGATDYYEARCRRCHSPRAEPTTAELFGGKE
jgi:thymidine kinase